MSEQEQATQPKTTKTTIVSTDAVVSTTGEMGLGPNRWVVNTTFAGVLAVVFVSLLGTFVALFVWGAHTVTNQAVEAHKATNELYLSIAAQNVEREKTQREDMVRIWQAISDNTRINTENTQINKKTQELLEQQAVIAKTLTEELKRLQGNKQPSNNK